MKVAVLGFGTVGRGVYEMLLEASALEPGRVLVRPGKERESFQTSRMEDILNDPETQAVAEAIGGLEPARSLVEQALLAGKHVVTTNKALVAAHGLELAALARERDLAFLFNAACGGGLPFLSCLTAAAEADEVLTVGGILNGTTNYILDAMQSRGVDYASALREAQNLGFAEADPTADVSGLDAARKLTLACAVAFDRLPEEGMLWEGIQFLTPDDILDFRARGLVCRLLVKGGRTENSVYCFVEPALVRCDSTESSVRAQYNLARYEARRAGDIVLSGQGAGRWPTASNVLRDLNNAAQGQREMIRSQCHRVRADNEGCERSYYVRLPISLARTLPERETIIQGETARVLTHSMTVARMHALAQQWRDTGAPVFFAGIED